MATEAKSKRDLIWEQKRKAREERLRGGTAEESQPVIPQNANKKAQFIQEDYDPQENFNPMANNKYNQNENNFNSIPSTKETRSNPNAMNFNQQNDRRNDNRGDDFQNGNDFVQAPQKKMNFNPSFEPTQDFAPSIQQPDPWESKKKKYEYGDFLRDQMKEKEAKKLDRSENNNQRQQQQFQPQQYQQQPYQQQPYQQQQYQQQQYQQQQYQQQQYQQQQQQQQEYNQSMEKAAENRKKNDYGEYLRNQMKEKELSRKSQDLERKGVSIPSMAEQSYDPFGRGGSGAPLRDYNNNVRKDTIETRNEYQNPRNAYVPASQASSKPQSLQEPEIVYGNQQNIISLNGEDVKAVVKKMPLSSEHPQEVARREKMKLEFQKGLQEQIEEKKRQKKMEEQRKREEERQELQRIQKEQEEIDRRHQMEKDAERKKSFIEKFD